MSVKSELDVIVDGEDRLSPTLDTIQSRLIRFVGAVSSALTAIQIATFPVKAIREFEAELANVQKTTGFTDNQIKTLGDRLVDLSRKINVSAKDLATIAAAAGQQGLGREGVEGIEAFTVSVSRMASVLDLTVEQAGTDIGKIASIFKVPLRDIELAVSSFNEVANNSTASGEQLLDVVKRIGDAAGSLNLEQSIGLSATGIDLGLSPEVVGTSFSKIFAEMYARAGQFSKLLGVSVEDWMKQLQTNGIDALKQYLDGLRKLTPEAQQQTIKALSGGGRIGVLVTKLLRDTEDEILDRNVASATKGITEGTSALKEQQTVLQTLNAEIQKSQNSFQDLGIIAGERFVKPLAGYFAELNTAMSSEGAVAFAEAVGDAFGDLIHQVAELIRFLGELNINWGNFIQVAKVWISLKLVQVLAGMALKIPGIGAAWAQVAQQATAAGEAQQKAATTGSSALTTQIARVRELIAARKAYLQSMKEQDALQAQLAQNQAKLQQAEINRENARGLVNQARVDIVDAGRGVTTAKGNVAAAEQAAAARTAAVQAALNQRLVQAEQDSQQRITAIQYEYMQQREVARSVGTRKQVAEVNAAERQALAAQEAAQARSLRSIQSYYARRMAMAQEAGAAEVAQARLGLMQSFGQFDSVVNSSNMSKLTDNFEKAGAAIATANNNLNATKTRLSLAQRTAAAATTAFTMLGAGIRLASAALQGLVAIAGRAFFWLTILYTVIDALGLTEKLGGWFEKLTDYMGLTSEASRKLEAQERARARAHDEAKRAAEEAADGLKPFIDAAGKLTEAGRTQIGLKLDDTDLESYRKGVDNLLTTLAGSEAELAKFNQATEQLPIDREAMEKSNADAKAILEERAAELAKAQATLDRVNSRGGLGASELEKEVARLQKSYDEQASVVKNLEKELENYTESTLQNLAEAATTAKTNLAELDEFVQKTFTEESANAFLKFIPNYVKAVEEQKAALASLEDAQQKANEANGKEGEAAANAAVESAQTRVEAANANIRAIATTLKAYIEDLKKTGGLSEAAVGSLDFLPNFLNSTTNQLNALLGAMNRVKGSGETFTGQLAAPVPKADQGEGTNEQQTAAQARRLARSRIDLTRATLQSIAELEKQASDEMSAELERNYEDNLVTYSEYYAKRLEIQKRNIDIEARLKRDEIDALNTELSEATEESEQNRIKASITRSQGQLDVLAKQKQALDAETEHDLQEALKQFSDRVKDQRQALVDYFGAGSDQEAFQATLESVESRYREFVERLKVEATNMPELLPTIDAIELQGKFQAVEAGLEAISRKSALAQANLDLTGERIEAMAEAGVITRGEAVAYEERLRKQLIETKKAALEASKARLAQLAAEGGEAAKLTTKYQELQLAVRGQEVEIEKLQLTANETAKEINDDFKASFKNLLLDATDNDGSLKDAMIDFGLSLLDTLRDKASEGLADIAFQAIGSVGDGGIGGMFASLFGETSDSVEKMRGSSPATPMFVSDVNAAVPGAESGVSSLLGAAKETATDGATKTAEGQATEGLTNGVFEDTFEGLGQSVSDLGSTIWSGFSSFAGTLGSGFMSGISQLMSLIGTIASSIIAAIFASSATDATAGALQAGASAAMAAHNGAIVGQMTMKRTNIPRAVFADAVRYHTGGEVGLAPNEVPAILEKGEEVLTKDDPRHRDNLGSGGAGGDSPAMNPIFKVQPVLSEDAVLDAMKGSAGEKLLLVKIARNPQAFRNALGMNK